MEREQTTNWMCCHLTDIMSVVWSKSWILEEAKKKSMEKRKMTQTLTGKVALVTGGSRGIGAATARALAESGADVAISYTDTVSTTKAEAIASELREKGVRALAFRADQADSFQVTGLIEQVVEHFGHLDILVNNAGI